MHVPILPDQDDPDTAALPSALLTIPQVAGILQIHPDSVRDMIARGEIPACQLHGRAWSSVRVRARDLNAVIESWTGLRDGTEIRRR